MKIIGISSTTNEAGEKSYTLHCMEAFPEYANESDKGRQATGNKVEVVYVGKYDCSNFKIGDELDISYGKAVTTKTGTFQPIKKIDVVHTTSAIKGGI